MLSKNRQRSLHQDDLRMGMIDMAGNINDVINLYQRFRANPMQFLGMRYNIPPNINLNNPNDIVQHLLNTGQVKQTQVNAIMNMRNNPMIQQLMNHK